VFFQGSFGWFWSFLGRVQQELQIRFLSSYIEKHFWTRASLVVYYSTSLISYKAINIISSRVLIPTNIPYSIVELSSTSFITSLRFIYS